MARLCVDGAGVEGGVDTLFEGGIVGLGDLIKIDELTVDVVNDLALGGRLGKKTAAPPQNASV